MNSTLVSFPELGWSFNVPRVAFNIFGKPIYWYGIIIAAAFLICVLWAMKDAPKYDLVPDTIIDLMLFAAPAAIICARLYYVIFTWSDYSDNLIDILNLRKGGLAIYGGIIGAIITAYFLARYKRIPIMKLFDFTIPYVALGQAIGRWGNFFNQEAFGTNTSLPWGMTSPTITSYLTNKADSIQKTVGITVNPDLPVHPTFLYESLWNIAIFAFLMWMRKRKKFSGEIFCLYFITYSIGRAIIEGLRTDSLMLGNLRVSQFLSILLIVAFGILVIVLRNKAKNAVNEVESETAPSAYANVIKYMEEEEQAEQEQQAVESNEHSTESLQEEENTQDVQAEFVEQQEPDDSEIKPDSENSQEDKNKMTDSQ